MGSSLPVNSALPSGANRVASPQGLAVAFCHASIAEFRAGRVATSKALVRQAVLLDPGSEPAQELQRTLEALEARVPDEVLGADVVLLNAIAALRLEPPDVGTANRIVAEVRARGHESDALRQLERFIEELQGSATSRPFQIGWGRRGAIAASLLAVGFIGGVFTRSDQVPSADSAVNSVVTPPNTGHSVDLRRLEAMVDAALGGSDIELLRAHEGLNAATDPPALVAEIQRRSPAAAKRQLDAARKAYSAGGAGAAIEQLRLALSPLRGTWLEDDALYLLGLSLSDIGDAEAARGVANSLLQEHPTSIFANSRIKRIAGENVQ